MAKIGGRDSKNGNDASAHISCDNDNDEEVVVTNEDDECAAKKYTAKDSKRTDKSKYVWIIHSSTECT